MYYVKIKVQFYSLNTQIMRSFFVFIFVLIFTGQGFCQPNPLGTFNRYVAENWTGEYLRIGQYKVKGTPYLFGESFEGKLVFEGGSVTSRDKVLYNLYEQKAGPDIRGEILETTKQLDEFSMNLPEKFGGQTLLFKHSRLFNKSDLNVFFNVISDGPKTAFLKIYRIRLIPDPTNMYDKESRLFEQYFDYYLFTSGNLTKVKLRKKDFVKALQSIPGAEEKIDEANIDFFSEKEIALLIAEINQ